MHVYDKVFASRIHKNSHNSMRRQPASIYMQKIMIHKIIYTDGK